jgi:hypothetical protein
MTSTRNEIREAQKLEQNAKQAMADLDATTPEVLDQIAKGLIKQIKSEPLKPDTQKAFEDYINQFAAYVGALRNLSVFLLGDKLENNGG